MLIYFLNAILITPYDNFKVILTKRNQLIGKLTSKFKKYVSFSTIKLIAYTIYLIRVLLSPFKIVELFFKCFQMRLRIYWFHVILLKFTFSESFLNKCLQHNHCDVSKKVLICGDNYVEIPKSQYQYSICFRNVEYLYVQDGMFTFDKLSGTLFL